MDSNYPTDAAVLLTLARALFLEQGTRLSLGEIAEALGVSEGELCSRFGDRESLIHEALRPPPATWVEDLARGPDARPIEAQLEEIAARAGSYLDRVLPARAVMGAAKLAAEPGSATGAGEPVHKRAERAMTAWFRAAIESGRLAPTDPRHAAVVFLGSLTFSSMTRQFTRAPSEEGPTPEEVSALVRKTCQALEQDPLEDPGED